MEVRAEGHSTPRRRASGTSTFQYASVLVLSFALTLVTLEIVQLGGTTATTARLREAEPADEVDILGEYAAIVDKLNAADPKATSLEWAADHWQCHTRGDDWLPPARMVYNRIFKTGSVTVGGYLITLCFSNRPCTYVHSQSYDFFDVVKDEELRAKLVAGIAKADYNETVFPFEVALNGQVTVDQANRTAPLPAVIYDAHMPFVDFTQYGYSQPLFINWVREPIRRIGSHYSYNEHYRVQYKKDYPCSWNMTFDQCLDMKRAGSCPEEIYDCQPANMMTTFLCGTAEECADPSSPQALQRALHNIQYLHAAVGVLEHKFLSMDYFAEVIKSQFNVPTRFKKWAKVNKVKYNAQSGGATSKTLRQLSPQNLAAVKAANINDVLLYDYIVKRMFTNMRGCGYTEPHPSHATPEQVQWI